jgi:tRNA (guanine-N7-)-methyltransferase
MSRRNKLKKFADIFSFSNVYENFDSKTPKLTDREGRVMDIRGRWAQDHFGTANPIIAELACGYGEYTLELARRHPERHFIGVDIKGARIWQGARRALEEELRNVAFLRCRVEHLDHFFASGELQEIWITFPDPFPRDSRARRRLTAPHFLELYRRLLAPSGLVHLKTDDEKLYEYTLRKLAECPGAHVAYHIDDIYAGHPPFPELDIKTYYERMHLGVGKTIKYIRFCWS